MLTGPARLAPLLLPFPMRAGIGCFGFSAQEPWREPPRRRARGGVELSKHVAHVLLGLGVLVVAALVREEPGISFSCPPQRSSPR